MSCNVDGAGGFPSDQGRSACVCKQLVRKCADLGLVVVPGPGPRPLIGQQRGRQAVHADLHLVTELGGDDPGRPVLRHGQLHLDREPWWQLGEYVEHRPLAHIVDVRLGRPGFIREAGAAVPLPPMPSS